MSTKLLYILTVLLTVQAASLAQHTFSIVAIDPVTLDMGSAGATCLGGPSPDDGAFVIADVLKGSGVINSQSFYLRGNQLNARRQLQEGSDAQEIITWLSQPSNDVTRDPSVRQYGAVTVDSDGNIVADAFTGSNCFGYAGHIVGDYYAIQGNILLGREIIDSMEVRFLRAEGQGLAAQLMAAMQGANVPGADTRCLSDGVSSLSAYITVYNSIDNSLAPSLEIIVPQTPAGIDPIDRLQELYDLRVGTEESTLEQSADIYPNPATHEITILTSVDAVNVAVYDIRGNLVIEQHPSEGAIDVTDLPTGCYIVRLQTDKTSIARRFLKI
jgi:uncharacterized Ntn-hydrolase superfamily protein